MRTLLLLVLALPVVPAVLAAQQPPPAFERLEAGSCPACTLRLEFVTVLGSRDDKELVMDSDRPLALRDGGFVVWGGDDPRIKRYGETGRYIGTVGTPGEGPGEYSNPQVVALARGDSVTAFSYGRLTTLSSSTGRGRSMRIDPPSPAFELLTLRDGTTVVQNYLPPEPPFIVVTTGNNVESSFGPSASKVRRDDGRVVPDFDSQRFVLAPASSGGFWAAAMYYRHRISRWDTDGSEHEVIDRSPSWWQQYDSQTKADRRLEDFGWSRPLPFLLRPWVREGRLFVFSAVADHDWKRDPDAAPPSGQPQLFPRSQDELDYDGQYDAVIEVYDERKQELLGSWYSDRFPLIPIGEGLVGRPEQDSDGVISWVIWRVVFTER